MTSHPTADAARTPQTAGESPAAAADRSGSATAFPSQAARRPNEQPRSRARVPETGTVRSATLPADRTERDGATGSADRPKPPDIRLERLRVQYGSAVALDEVSLRFPAGAISAIIGPSGCGKTSLLWSINRLIEMVPRAGVSGDVRIDGHSVFSPETDLQQLRRRVGLIMQRPVVFPLSIWNNLELPLRDAGVAPSERRRRIEGALRETGLWEEVRERLRGPAGALSGGQQQRLCLARALALRPQALLLDEPCSALDPIATARIESLLQGLRGRVTIVIVTHNLAQARRLADQVSLLWSFDGGGRLVETADVQQFFQHPRHPLTRAYLAAETAP
ncbi:MAG: phosphate ABC transporter ATP-binding protein [Planctomycetota bacterium]|nr:MAG: phosphate ABC transporter ATP-binding protein [Planctomycetota bacterium]